MAYTNIPGFNTGAYGTARRQTPVPGSPEARNAEFESYMQQFPGAAPGGTGATGLSPIDGRGFSQLLERQQQYLQDTSGGKYGVKFGGYDGTQGAFDQANGRGVSTAIDRSGNDFFQGESMSHPALRGLETAIKGPAGGAPGGGLPQMIADDPDLYHMYEMGLIDDMQGAGRTARRQGMRPADLIREEADADLEVGPYLAGMKRDAAYTDSRYQSRAKARNFWDDEQPIEAYRQDQALDKIHATGEANAIDDRERAVAAIQQAMMKLQGTQITADASQRVGAARATAQDAGNARQYGDTQRTGAATNALDDIIRQLMQGSGQPQGGGAPQTPPMPGAPQPPQTPAPGPQGGAKPLANGGMLTDAMISAAMAKQGWDRQTAIAQAQAMGYRYAGGR